MQHAELTGHVVDQHPAPASPHRGVLTGIFALILIAVAVLGAGPAHAATSIETMPLWRLQARITTGSTPTAGTNGTPALRFNASTTGVRTMNPPAPSAFDAGHVDTYDLRLLTSPSEITMLRVGISGGDDWCVKKVELLFNNRVAFAQDTVPGGACASINNGTFEYSYAALRNNPAWVGYGTPPALPTRMSAPDLRALVTSVTGSAMLSSPGVRWDPTAPLTLTRATSSSVRASYGIEIRDPSGIEATFTARITYDAHLFVGSDGNLHAAKTNASCCYHYAMSDAVIAQLDTALSRMTFRPRPHDPLRYGVDAVTNIDWGYAPVLVG